jgi:hypothetical protein
MSAGFPLEVLGEALQERIAGRRARAAVFTTFSFDPGFFELQILPVLFDRPFSQVEQLRRVQLEDALREFDHVAVYFDRSALAQDASPAQLDFRRIDVRRSTGVFHPKVVLLLVEEAAVDDDQKSETPARQSVVVAVLSANLTRAGWWENVEAGHVDEIPEVDVDSSRMPFRKDLLALMRRIREAAADDEDHRALDAIREFLLRRTSTATYSVNRAGGRYLTRLYFGQSDLPRWFEEVGLGRGDWNLEIISPFFDAHDASTLARLLEVVQPRETRVFLPARPDGTAAVTRELYRAVDEYAWWSDMPAGVLRQSSAGKHEHLPPRRVHAKVYRLWQIGGPDVVLVGSVNLTAPAHSHVNAGNLEAAFLVDVTDDRQVRTDRWWLDRLDWEPKEFNADGAAEEDDSQQVFVDISFRYDWSAGTLEYRIEGPVGEDLTIAEPEGPDLFVIRSPRRGRWIECGAKAADAVRRLLKSTSFLLVKHPAGSWRVLVREEGMSHRPSLVFELTPEEILMYWSLLSPEQRQYFLEEKASNELTQEGLPINTGRRFTTGDTVFDRFAGVYHAFERLCRYVDQAVTDGRNRDAVARLFGAKYDSLPVLLTKVLNRSDPDPVMSYITFLCARQVVDRIAGKHREFYRSHRSAATVLDRLLAELPRLRDELPLDDDGDREPFLDWYESMFLEAAAVLEDAE